MRAKKTQEDREYEAVQAFILRAAEQGIITPKQKFHLLMEAAGRRIDAMPTGAGWLAATA